MWKGVDYRPGLEHPERLTPGPLPGLWWRAGLAVAMGIALSVMMAKGCSLDIERLPARGHNQGPTGDPIGFMIECEKDGDRVAVTRRDGSMGCYDANKLTDHPGIKLGGR